MAANTMELKLGWSRKGWGEQWAFTRQAAAKAMLINI